MRDESRARTGEAGFSLVELLVAMVITLVIMGAVYGLIAGGQNAFRREPELAERQQNIRMAMDLIMKDIGNAGSGLPTFVQTFTPALNSCAGCPTTPDSATDRTDEIEILTNSESRDTEPICRTPGIPPALPIPNGGNVRLIRNVTIANPPPPNTVVVPFTANGQWTLREMVTAVADGAAAFDCTAGNHTLVNLTQAGGTMGLNTVTACDPNTWGNMVAPCQLVGLSFANLVRYRIRPDVNGVPMLERWSSDSPGAINANARVEASFQVIARGIENLQVQYLRADGDPGTPTIPGDWVDAAPVVITGDYASVITQVRVTLAARSEAQNISGATTSVAGGDRIRGTLMSSGSPRATLMNLTLASPAAPVIWR